MEGPACDIYFSYSNLFNVRGLPPTPLIFSLLNFFIFLYFKCNVTVFRLLLVNKTAYIAYCKSIFFLEIKDKSFGKAFQYNFYLRASYSITIFLCAQYAQGVKGQVSRDGLQFFDRTGMDGIIKQRRKYDIQR